MEACTQTDMVSQGFHELAPLSVDSEGVSNEPGREQALSPETEKSSEGPEIPPCEVVVRKLTIWQVVVREREMPESLVWEPAVQEKYRARALDS